MALFSDESSLQPGPQSSYAALGIALHSGAQLCADGGSWHKGGARRGFLAAVGGKNSLRQPRNVEVILASTPFFKSAYRNVQRGRAAPVC